MRMQNLSRTARNRLPSTCGAPVQLGGQVERVLTEHRAEGYPAREPLDAAGWQGVEGLHEARRFF
jgi:hypothetical protein